MIERIGDMPAGAVGLRASGKLTKDDYTGAAWKRFALVTDVEWVAKAMHMFAWMTPGEVMTYGLDELGQAKRWVAG